MILQKSTWEKGLSTVPNPKFVRDEASERAESYPRFRWWWIASPILLAIFLTVYLVVLTLRVQDLQRTVKKAEQQAAQQVSDLANARRMLETLSAKDALRVSLSARQDQQPTAQTVYDRDRGRLVLIASNLAPLTPGHVYQLWLIPPGNATPIPAGVFWPDERGHASMFMTMPPNIKTSGFEVTIETEGGATQPTTKPILAGTTTGATS